MSSVLDKTTHSVQGSSAQVSFRDDRSGDGPWRSLLIAGRPAYNLGTMCDTCGFLFERMNGANQSVSPDEIASALRGGISELDKEVIRAAGQALPDGAYNVALLELVPKLVWPGDEGDYFTHEQLEVWGIDPFWGLPENPRVPYFRTPTRAAPDDALLFEFVVPMFPPRWLDVDVVADYRGRLRNGHRPTAFGVSVLDVREPAMFEVEKPEKTKHWCLAHFLLDGNHKMYAAAEAAAPARLLTFISLDWSIATGDEVDQALDLLGPASEPQSG
jgi:hypothetical protein